MKFENRFRWASLQLDLLCALKSDTDIRSRLGRLPPKLEDLYVEIYDHLTSGPGTTDRTIVQNTLTWLLCAQRTLRSHEFLCAVAVKAEMAAQELTKDMVLELCHNLIVYDNSLDTFRFAHLSVREFLERKPDYTTVYCHSLAAESCLLYLIGSVQYSATAPASTDRFIVKLQKKLRLPNTMFHTGMLDYANNWWAYHCKLASQDTPLARTSFVQVFHDFMLNGVIYREAIHGWAEWFCRNVPGFAEAQGQESKSEFQSLLSSHPSALSRSFFISIAYGFSYITHAVLRKRHISEQEKIKALGLAALYDQGCSFDILMDTDQDLQISSSVVRRIAHHMDSDRLTRLVQRYPSTKLEQSMVVACLEGGDDRKVTLLLENHPSFAVTGETLVECFKSASPLAFALLMARIVDSAEYQEILSEIIIRMRLRSWSRERIQPKLAKLRSFLERAGSSCITPDVVVSATNPRFYPAKMAEAILEVLFEYGGASKITEEAMIKAARHKSRGMLDMLLRHGGRVTQGVLDGAAESVTAEVLEALINWGCEIDGEVLRLAAQSLSILHEVKTGLDVLLDFADDELIAQEGPNLLRDAVGGRFSSPGSLRRLLDRIHEPSVTEDVLIAAAKNGCHASKAMQSLLERARISEISENVIVQSLKFLDLDDSLRLLERVGKPRIEEQCLISAAENEHCGSDLVRSLLKKTDWIKSPQRALMKAIANRREGEKVLIALEEVFGPIELTEKWLLSALCQDNFGGVKIPQWLTPEMITERVLIAAMKNCDSTAQMVADKASHVAITLEILEVAAQRRDLVFFRFLWNRGRLAKIPERLFEAAARNCCDGLQIIGFLLDDAEEVQISDQFYVTIIERTGERDSILNLLCERGYPLQVTQKLLESVTKAPGRAIEKLLESNPGLEITDELFGSRATHGEEGILHKFAKYCGMENPPSKCVDIAKLYNASWRGDDIALQEIVDHGVEVNILDPWGYTPLFRAVDASSISSVEILLSAGADANLTGRQNSPLSRAARWEDIDMVKALVEAGASIDFKNDKGKTPELIAKEDGNSRAFRYLEQCRKAKEEAE